MKNGDLPGQVLRYFVVGVSGVTLDAVIYYILLRYGVSITPAKGVSITASVIYGYCLNARWTFRAGFSKRSLAAYCIVYATSIILNMATNTYLAHSLPEWCFPIVMAFLVATAVSICITFSGLKFWVFKKKNSF